jgi:Concanavalin A-like lectin/glucanases superfamily
MTRTGSFGAGIIVGLLLAAACGVLLWEPWHGAVVMSLSESHGIDAGDLPALSLIALAVAIGHARVRDALTEPRWSAGHRTRGASAIVLGALLLLVGVIGTASDPPLLPAGGGTFDSSTQHANGRRADPVDRWSHLALTYDGLRLRLFVDGTPASSRAVTGTILRTTDPLWIGGNRPYGEYFKGVIDEVHVYDRALSPSDVKAEMSPPIASGRISAEGLVGAYAFDAGSGTVAADTSGHGNSGTIRGARWTTRGRFGRAMRFDGAGEVVRVPASASLNVRAAMTLSAWIRPTESQSGWRTIVHRQTDAFFLMAGGGSYPENRPSTLDDARLALVIMAGVWFCLALASSRPPLIGGLRVWYWPQVALFLAGSVADAVLAPADTLIGPTLVAMWCARAASHRGEVISMYLMAGAFAGATIMAVAGSGGPELSHDDGGVVRSTALGVLLVTAGLLSVRRGLSGGERCEPERT